MKWWDLGNINGHISWSLQWSHPLTFCTGVLWDSLLVPSENISNNLSKYVSLLAYLGYVWSVFQPVTKKGLSLMTSSDATFMHLHAFSCIRGTTEPICQCVGKMIWTHFLTSARETWYQGRRYCKLHYKSSLGSIIWEVTSEAEAETKYKQEKKPMGKYGRSWRISNIWIVSCLHPHSRVTLLAAFSTINLYFSQTTWIK